jgi:hypothetical protein
MPIRAISTHAALFIRRGFILVRLVITTRATARIELSALAALYAEDLFEEGESQDAFGRFGVELFDERRKARFGVRRRETDEGFEGTCCEG